MKKACTFFGHRDCPDSIRADLRKVLEGLIAYHGVEQFYVGRQGAFDALARSVLEDLAAEFPHIDYAIVLERPPGKRDTPAFLDWLHTVLPEGIETVHPRFAISWRNDWMLRQSHYVVTYITHPWGGAARFASKAIRQNKIVINLAE